MREVTLTIGDTTRDGLLEIMDTRWDSNGTMFVTIREKIGTGCWVGGSRWHVHDDWHDALSTTPRRHAQRVSSVGSPMVAAITSRSQ